MRLSFCTTIALNALCRKLLESSWAQRDAATANEDRYAKAIANGVALSDGHTPKAANRNAEGNQDTASHQNTAPDGNSEE